MRTQALPRGFDLIHTRDALQHLSCRSIVAALRTLATSNARYLLVGFSCVSACVSACSNRLYHAPQTGTAGPDGNAGTCRQRAAAAGRGRGPGGC